MAEQQEIQTQPAAENISPDRAAVLAELEAMSDQPEEPAQAPAEEGDAEKVEATEQSDDQAVEEAADAAQEEPKAEERAEADPDLEKRLAAVQKAEQRAKEAVAAERAELQKQLEEWQPRIEAAQEFEKLQSRARYDLPAVLQQLGVQPEDFEPLARQLYAHRPGAEDPSSKETAARSAREREMADRVARQEKQIQELMQRIEGQQQQAQVEQRVNAFLEQVTKAVGETTPLVQKFLSNDPQEARRSFADVAYQLATEYGEDPEPSQVVKRLEEMKVAELRRYGIDPAQAVGTATTKTEPRAEEKRTARTLSSDLGTPTKPPDTAPKSRDQMFDEVRRALETGSIE